MKKKTKLIKSKLLDSVLKITYDAIYSLKSNKDVVDYVISVLWHHIERANTKKGKVALFRIMLFFRKVKKLEDANSAASMAYQILYRHQLGYTAPMYKKQLEDIQKALEIPFTFKQRINNEPLLIEYTAKA